MHAGSNGHRGPPQLGEAASWAGWIKQPRLAAGLIFLAAAGTIAGALVFEHGFGLAPCKLCLIQRYPYYAAMPLALLAWLAPIGPGARRWTLAALVAVFAVSLGLGVHHAGVEWGWWPGPTDCGGGAPATGNVADLMKSLQTTRVVSCTDAAWRFLGLSLAGWNAVISLALAALAVGGIRTGYGDRSV